MIDGISFGPAAGFMAFHHGVAKYLQNTFELDGLSFAGVSAGSQPAVFLAAGIPMDLVWDQWFDPSIESITDSNKKHSTLIPPDMFDIFKEFFKPLDDGTMVRRCNRYMYLSVTQLPSLRPLTLHCFTDFDDLFRSIEATQCIPFIFENMSVECNSTQCIDGGIGLRGKPYEPYEGDWIHILYADYDVNTFIGDGTIALLAHLTDMSYHNKKRAQGYAWARSKHDYFLKRGLKLKCSDNT